MQKHNSKVKSDLKTRCYYLSLRVISFVDSVGNSRSVQVLSNQLLRSTTSIGANLVEATASSSRLEFKKYHEIALKSANETKYWIGLMRDSNKAEREQANKLLQEVTEIANMLASGILRLKGKK